MNPDYNVLSAASRSAGGWLRRAGYAAGMAVFLSGCSKPPEMPALSSATDGSARGVEDRVLVAPHEIGRPQPLTAEETVRQQKLEAQLAQERPTHRLRFRSGRVVEGHIVSETPDAVRVRDGFGYSGYVVATYKRTDISSIEPLPAAPFEVTARDVRFSAEFSEFHFVKVPPYTIVTDESYGEVQRILGLLTSLREEFLERFAPLITDTNRLQDIHVVFFGSEGAFRTYAEHAAPAFAGSAGFYSSSENRLALLNQLGTAHYAEAQTRLDERGRQLSRSANAGAQIATLRSGLTLEAKSINERLIRHEGAHQLFHAYHIHSRYGIDPTWLVEGLAEYCETAEIGRYHFTLAERIAQARATGRFLPLKTLLNHRDPSGFFALGKANLEVAYAESWALVCMLMQDDYRNGFFDYLRSYRDLADDRAATAQAVDPVIVLERHLKTNFDTLQYQWDSFISHM
jgi:hypothetical protein